MALLKRFGEGLQRARKVRGLTQEDFSSVSSRTYLSSLERGLKSPTITKIEQLANVIGIHPMSLLALAYIPDGFTDVNALVAQITADLAAVEASHIAVNCGAPSVSQGQ